MKRRVPGPAERAAYQDAFQVFSSGAPPPPPYVASPSAYAYGQQQQQQQQPPAMPPAAAPAAPAVHHRNVGMYSSGHTSSNQQYFVYQQQQLQQPSFTPSYTSPASSLYPQQQGYNNYSNSNNIYSNYAAAPPSVSIMAAVLAEEGDEKKRRGQVNKQKKLTAVSRTVRTFRRILIVVSLVLVVLQLCRYFIQQKGLQTSNFILFDTVDLSPMIALYYYYYGAQTCRPDMYYWNGIGDTHHHDEDEEDKDDETFDCTFNLCSPISQGNEGRLYDGLCYSKKHPPHSPPESASSTAADAAIPADADAAEAERPVARPVVLKSMNQRVGPWLQHEITASQIIGKQEHDSTATNAALTHYAHGFNFIVMSHLVDYRTLYDVHADQQHVPPHQLKHFLYQQGLQVMQQLQSLHRNGYLHLDVWAPNIMYKSHLAAAAAEDSAAAEEGPQSWDFQLIDFSSVRPIAQAKSIIQESMHNHFHLPKMPAMVCLLKNDYDDISGYESDSEHQGQWKHALEGRLGHLMDRLDSGNNKAAMMDDDESSYCAEPQVVNAIRQQKICLAFLDAYPLAIRMLHDLYTLGGPSLPNSNDDNTPASSSTSSSHRPWPYRQLEKSHHPTLADILEKHEEYMDILKILETEHGRDDPTVQLIAQWTDLSRLNATLVCEGGGNNNNEEQEHHQHGNSDSVAASLL